MKIDLGLKMVRARVIDKEQEDDARILAERKTRRERLLESAKDAPKGPCFIVTWFRNRRTMATL